MITRNCPLKITSLVERCDMNDTIVKEDDLSIISNRYIEICIEKEQGKKIYKSDHMHLIGKIIIPLKSMQ
ncbi:hypothetical protein V1478_005743 [Vespula squamosa]|uniref:Uncharacterized protein n=1 Tax=Vespula squamosa TaxID=30214 RepID=A0ABD2BA70_VESSQ